MNIVAVRKNGVWVYYVFTSTGKKRFTKRSHALQYSREGV